jgi:hypothetical protein
VKKCAFTVSQDFEISTGRLFLVDLFYIKEQYKYFFVKGQVDLPTKQFVTCNYTLSGCLLNVLVEELIIRVTTVEDIPATTAVHLVTVFGVVIDRAPRVFQVKAQYLRQGQTLDYRKMTFIRECSYCVRTS